MRRSMFDDEASVVIDLINHCPGEYVIEIGCFEGVLTRRLANFCRNKGKKLIAIDPWSGSQDYSDEEVYQTFLKKTAGQDDVLTVIRGYSHLVKLPDEIKNECSVVVVDGDHSYGGCKRDLQRYYPLLCRGGALAAHDTVGKFWVGVAQAFNEFVESLPPPQTVTTVYHIPTEEESTLHEHTRAGISYFFKR